MVRSKPSSAIVKLSQWSGIPRNRAAMVKQIDGQSCYPSLEAIPEPVDIVNVFRHPDYLPEIVESAIAIQAATLWTQLKIYHPVAEKKAIEAGLNVIMDACIQIEYQRLFP